MNQENPSRTAPVNTPHQPAAGKGQPAREPQPQKPMTGRHPDLSDVSAEQSLKSPNDRDQTPNMTSGQPSPIIEQAAKDVEGGLKDTSKAPELDRTYKKL